MAGPLPVIANVYRCAFKWQSSTGQTAVNVMHFETAAGQTIPDVFECLQDTITRPMFGVVSNTFVVSEIDITALDGTTATGTFPTGSPLQFTGSSGGDFVPGVSAVVKLQTAKRGRSHRGRVFLPAVGEASMANGALDGTTVGTMQTDWTAFLAATAADPTTPMNLVVASYKLATADIVLQAVVEGVAGTQRRRQGRLR